MNILIFAANWYNRGDESAIRAMIDELQTSFPKAQFKIHFASMQVKQIPYRNLEIIPRFSNVQRRYIFHRIMYKISIVTRSKINIMPSTRVQNEKSNKEALKKFVEAVKWCDFALYAPGGPCIGDLYRTYTLLDCIDIIRHLKKPYAFYAPSMGPFKQYKGRIKKILQEADAIYLRENISANYVRDLLPDVDVNVTLDSAFQHEIDEKTYSQQLDEYIELKEFLETHEKIVGVTITDLKWHSKYATANIRGNINDSFKDFIKYLVSKGYGVVFIPQLFGKDNDKQYMSTFAINNCFIVDDIHDCYFQQYLISKLYAVVGMRYHSNIFSAKMGTPFISIAYEQKMKGFVDKVGLPEYCFFIEDLSFNNLTEYFEKLENNYNEYKKKLFDIKKWCKQESYKTTECVINLLNRL